MSKGVKKILPTFLLEYSLLILYVSLLCKILTVKAIHLSRIMYIAIPVAIHYPMEVMECRAVCKIRNWKNGRIWKNTKNCRSECILEEATNAKINKWVLQYINGFAYNFWWFIHWQKSWEKNTDFFSPNFLWFLWVSAGICVEVVHSYLFCDVIEHNVCKY